VSAEELRASINRAAGMPPSGEPTSAALRRVTDERDAANELTDKIAVELRGVTKERDALARRCAVRFEETQALKAELESARAELALVRRQRDTLRADLDRARNRAEAAERELAYAARSGWIVARDGGRDCLDCDREIRRGEAYELVPGEGPDALRHVHCRPKEKSMTNEDLDPILSAAWGKLRSGVQEQYESATEFGPILAAALRVMADETEVEPSFPMTAALAAEMICERADALAGGIDA
jgi:DNA repair exonuclease SbcCD ATPase subunit